MCYNVHTKGEVVSMFISEEQFLQAISNMMDKKLDARQYLLSLQQNYHNDDDIEGMIQERLEKLK